MPVGERHNSESPQQSISQREIDVFSLLLQMNLSSIIVKLPTGIQTFLRSTFKRAPFTYTLRTGVHVVIEDRSDFSIYTELFVCGDYDEAIKLATENRKTSRQELFIMDLGANKGFFLLRLIDRLRAWKIPTALTGLAIEGAKDTFIELVHRVSSYPDLANVNCIQKLVGARTGSASLTGGHSSSLASVSENGQNRVDYVDLNSLTGHVETIDLLKCDIEGSEQAFVENYPELLQKVKIMILEVHPRQCNADAVMKIIEHTGLEIISVEEGFYGAKLYTLKRPQS